MEFEMKVYTIESVSQEQFTNGNLREVKDTLLENVLTSKESVKKWCSEHSHELMPNYYWNIVEWDLEDGGFVEYRLDKDGEDYILSSSTDQEDEMESEFEDKDNSQKYNYSHSNTNKVLGPELDYAFTHIWSGLKIIGRRVSEEAQGLLKK